MSWGLGQRDIERLALAILVMGILTRFLLASLWTVSGDACWHLNAAQYLAENGQFPLFEPIGRDEPFWPPPLFHLSASLLYLLFGGFGMKLLSPLLGSGLLVVSYLLFRDHLTKRQTLYGMLFLSFLPLTLDYSVLAYTDMMLAFLLVLTLYLGLKDRILLASLTAGLAVLTKYHGVLVVALLLFVIYRRHKNVLSRNFLSRSSLAAGIPAMLALPWLVRNWLLLGNPIWPFLNFLFGGYEQLSYSSIDISRLFSPLTWTATYLGFFGVPDGNPQLFSFFSHPYLSWLFGIYILGTVLFLLPVGFGLRKSPLTPLAVAILGLFGLLFLVYVANVGPFVSRILLPGILGLAVFFAIGAERLERLAGHKGWAILLGLLLISAGFLAALSVKFSFASQAWNAYEDDFSWVRQHTPEDAVFLAGGQCLPYHLQRTALFPVEADTGSYGYVWKNDFFPLDPRSELTEEEWNAVLAREPYPVYENPATGTIIYSVDGSKTS